MTSTTSPGARGRLCRTTFGSWPLGWRHDSTRLAGRGDGVDTWGLTPFRSDGGPDPASVAARGVGPARRGGLAQLRVFQAFGWLSHPTRRLWCMAMSAVSAGAVEVIEALATLVGRLDVAVLSGSDAADDAARRAALHRSRYLRTWTDRDGAGRVDPRLTPKRLARFQAYLRPFQTEQFHAARRAGLREIRVLCRRRPPRPCLRRQYGRSGCGRSEISRSRCRRGGGGPTGWAPRPRWWPWSITPPWSVVTPKTRSAGSSKGSDQSPSPRYEPARRRLLGHGSKRRDRYPIRGPHRPASFVNHCPALDPGLCKRRAITPARSGGNVCPVDTAMRDLLVRKGPCIGVLAVKTGHRIRLAGVTAALV